MAVARPALALESLPNVTASTKVRPPMVDISTFLAEEAANPATPQDRLAELAQTRPELRRAIASNPNCYPELLSWIEEADLAAADEVGEEKYRVVEVKWGREGSFYGTPPIVQEQPEITTVVNQFAADGWTVLNVTHDIGENLRFSIFTLVRE
jgi:hypothetical protein